LATPTSDAQIRGELGFESRHLGPEYVTTAGHDRTDRVKDLRTERRERRIAVEQEDCHVT
jgi:hypothetical protein